jgi:hypothetical protein
VVSRVGVVPVQIVFWFLEHMKEIDGADKLFFRYFMLVSFPLLFNLSVECIISALTGHSLFQWCPIIDFLFQFIGWYLSLFKRDGVWISVCLEPVVLESSDGGGGAIVSGDGRHREGRGVVRDCVNDLFWCR